jgi:inorganic triphosphatase YgiF
VELELKVSALPGEDLPEETLLSLADKRLGLIGEVQRLVLEAHYHDDSLGLLRSQGWALRARMEGDVLIATAKGPEQDRNGVPARPEINARITALPAAGSPLPEALANALKEAGLAINQWPGSQWVTRINRTFVEVRLPGGGSAELALDRGHVHSKDRSHPIVEFELELRQGEASELLSAAALLSEGLAVRPGGRSKAARGLQLLGRLRPPERGGEHSVKGLWKTSCELEEWLRDGYQEQQEQYIETISALLRELTIDKPIYLGCEFQKLLVALDSPGHAKLLWRIFSAIHQRVD